MASPTLVPDLWSIVRGTPQIDPHDLAAAIDAEARRGPHDFRTRLLIRDGVVALEKHWGKPRVWNDFSEPAKVVIEQIVSEDLGPAGFPTIERRIMDRTDRELIFRFLRELGEQISDPTRLELGGRAY